MLFCFLNGNLLSNSVRGTLLLSLFLYLLSLLTFLSFYLSLYCHQYHLPLSQFPSIFLFTGIFTKKVPLPHSTSLSLTLQHFVHYSSSYLHSISLYFYLLLVVLSTLSFSPFLNLLSAAEGNATASMLLHFLSSSICLSLSNLTFFCFYYHFSF